MHWYFQDTSVNSQDSLLFLSPVESTPVSVDHLLEYVVERLGSVICLYESIPSSNILQSWFPVIVLPILSTMYRKPTLVWITSGSFSEPGSSSSEAVSYHFPLFSQLRLLLALVLPVAGRPCSPICIRLWVPSSFLRYSLNWPTFLRRKRSVALSGRATVSLGKAQCFLWIFGWMERAGCDEVCIH